MVLGASKAQTLVALSGREREVAEKFAAGLTYREIGKALFIAPATVRTHLATIYGKQNLGCGPRSGSRRTLPALPAPGQAGCHPIKAKNRGWR